MEYPEIFPCSCLMNCGRVCPKGEVDWWTFNVNIQCYRFLCTKHPRRSLGVLEKWLWYSPFIFKQHDSIFLGLWVQIQFKNWKLLAFYNSTHLGQSEERHDTVPDSSAPAYLSMGAAWLPRAKENLRYKDSVPGCGTNLVIAVTTSTLHRLRLFKVTAVLTFW